MNIEFKFVFYYLGRSGMSMFTLKHYIGMPNRLLSSWGYNWAGKEYEGAGEIIWIRLTNSSYNQIPQIRNLHIVGRVLVKIV